MFLLKSLLGGSSVIYGGLNDGTPVQLYPSDIVPSGVICIWSGNQNNIPSGWALCDGNNGTPNLSNKFVLGYGTKSCGSTGGAETVSLSTANMPSHSHNASVNVSGLSVSEGGAHTHNITGLGTVGVYSGPNDAIEESRYSSKTLTTTSSGKHTHTISGSASVSIGTTGSNMAHNNMPPYYVLCYIMKL